MGEPRTVLVGAVEGSAAALRALVDAGLPPAGVVTLDPEARARHSDYTDLRPLAEAAGAEIVLTRDVNCERTLRAVRALRPDLLLVIGWSQICREECLAVPRLGSVGFHPAPLPHMRGRAVIPWTILLDERESGSTLFELAPGTDTGAILAQERFALAPDETARSLYERHKANLARMLPAVVRAAARDGLRGRPQDEGAASVCAKRTPEDGRIDWSRPASAVERLVRAVGDPYPGAFTTLDGERVAVPEARPVRGGPRFIGLAGQVQGRGAHGGWLVLCGDGKAVEILPRACEGRRLPIHRHLG